MNQSKAQSQSLRQSDLPFAAPLDTAGHSDDLRRILEAGARHGFAADVVSFRRGNRVRVQFVSLNTCATV